MAGNGGAALRDGAGFVRKFIIELAWLSVGLFDRLGTDTCCDAVMGPSCDRPGIRSTLLTPEHQPGGGRPTMRGPWRHQRTRRVGSEGGA